MKSREEIIETMARASMEACIKCYTPTAEPYDPSFPNMVHQKIAEAILIYYWLNFQILHFLLFSAERPTPITVAATPAI